jgi:hypothetical protein
MIRHRQKKRWEQEKGNPSLYSVQRRLQRPKKSVGTLLFGSPWPTCQRQFSLKIGHAGRVHEPFCLYGSDNIQTAAEIQADMMGWTTVKAAMADPDLENPVVKEDFKILEVQRLIIPRVPTD